MIGSKECNHCHEELPYTDFYKDRDKADGLKYTCKTCDDIRRMKRYEDHSEEEIVNCQARRIKFPEKYKEQNTKYRLTHLEQRAAHARKHKQRRRDAEGHHTDRQVEELKDIWDHRCLCCGDGDMLVRDHIVPLISGGSDDISNIQVLCHSCNSKKGVKIIDYRGAV